MQALAMDGQHSLPFRGVSMALNLQLINPGIYFTVYPDTLAEIPL
jgi:hypothetical protein